LTTGWLNKHTKLREYITGLYNFII